MTLGRTGDMELTEAVSPPLLAGVGRDAIWTYAGLLASLAGSLFVTAYVLRHLTAGDYGTFAIAVTVVGLFVVFDFGTSAGIVRAASREDTARGGSSAGLSGSAIPSGPSLVEGARADIYGAHNLNLLIGAATLLGTGVAVFVQWSAGDRARVELLTVLIGLSAALGFGTSTFLGIATGQRRFRLIAVAIAIGAAGESLAVVLLTKSLGLVALGIAEVVSVAVPRAVLVAWARRSVRWFRPLRISHGARRFRAMVAFSSPLLILGIAGQVIASTDILVLGAVSTAAVVGLYRAGTIVPNQISVLLYRGYDTAFPALTGSSDPRSQESATDLLTRVAAVIAGAVLGVAGSERVTLAKLVVGRRAPLSASVVGVFCLIWLVNVPAHAIALLLIARARQMRLAVLVSLEAAANLGLTLILVQVMGALGAAWATLITITISNLIGLPFVVRRELRMSSLRLVLVSGLGCEAAGIAAALVSTRVLATVLNGAMLMFTAAVTASVLGVALVCLISGTSARGQLRAGLRPRAGVDSGLPVPSSQV